MPNDLLLYLVLGLIPPAAALWFVVARVRSPLRKPWQADVHGWKRPALLAFLTIQLCAFLWIALMPWLVLFAEGTWSYAHYDASGQVVTAAYTMRVITVFMLLPAIAFVLCDSVLLILPIKKSVKQVFLRYLGSGAVCVAASLSCSMMFWPRV